MFSRYILCLALVLLVACSLVKAGPTPPMPRKSALSRKGTGEGGMRLQPLAGQRVTFREPERDEREFFGTDDEDDFEDSEAAASKPAQKRRSGLLDIFKKAAPKFRASGSSAEARPRLQRQASVRIPPGRKMGLAGLAHGAQSDAGAGPSRSSRVSEPLEEDFEGPETTYFAENYNRMF